MRQTKIVATISDQKCDVEFLQALHNAGMNVARLNTAHITTETAKMMVENIRKVSEKIAILVDTKGPEIRTCQTLSDTEVQEGESVTLSYSTGVLDDVKNICVNYKGFVNDLKVGNKILVDDGDIGFEVVEKHFQYLLCKVENSGVVKKRKSINVPGVEIKLPSLSEKDVEFIKFAVNNDIDFIAHSFVRNRADGNVWEAETMIRNLVPLDILFTSCHN